MNTMKNLLNPIFLATVNTSLDIGTMIGGLVDVLLDIGKYAGVILLIVNIISILLAKKNNDAAGMDKAVLGAIIGACLIGISALLKTVGILS